jgi:hypothetical protein
MDSGMVIANNRQVGAQLFQPTGRSRRNPTPMSETMTVTSVSRSATPACSTGSGWGRPGTANRAKPRAR